jgi:hypothetical protein
MSANLPKGMRNIEADKIYDVATHPSSIVFKPNSFPIDGSAIFKADNINGVRKEERVEMIKAIFLLFDSFMMCRRYENSSIMAKRFTC